MEPMKNRNSMTRWKKLNSACERRTAGTVARKAIYPVIGGHLVKENGTVMGGGGAEEDMLATIKGMVVPAGRKSLQLRKTTKKRPSMQSCGDGAACVGCGIPSTLLNFMFQGDR
jgi:hypothetical protein